MVIHRKIKFKKAYLTIVFVLLCSVLLIACNNIFDKNIENISEFRPDLYILQTDEYSIEVVSGFREKAFLIDGQTNGQVDFAIITVIPSDGVSDNVRYDFELKFSNQTFKGTMAVHPFNENYLYEIPVRTYGQPLSLSLTRQQSKTNEFELQTVFENNMINHVRALQIATNRLKTQISSIKKNGKLLGEIYLMFVKNPVNNGGGYFWYIAIHSFDNKTFAVLIDPVSEKILAERLE
ncbi:MAG: hypothetical protein LBU60_04560 [Clostridiales bacterium]|jgi:hypothetical protein|nr:hypothetical protein [Clostridiales bacterium]